MTDQRKFAPALERHCGSWIAVIDGRAVCETFDKRIADRFANHAGVTVYTAAQWLGMVNGAAA